MRTLGAALDFAIKELGGPVNVIPGSPVLTTTKSQIVNFNGDRVGLVIINLGVNDVFIVPGNVSSVSTGIRLFASGGSVSMNLRDDLVLPSYEWWGVTNSGSSALYILEVVRFALDVAGQNA